MKYRIQDNNKTKISDDEHVERLIDAIAFYEACKKKFNQNKFDEMPELRDIISYTYDMYDLAKKEQSGKKSKRF